MLSGKSSIYFMLSYPIDHVKSPGMFNQLFAREGIDAAMVPLAVQPGRFEQTWSSFRHLPNLKGMIVSVPFKAQAAQLADVVSLRAERAGTANAIIRDEDGKLRADNFDGAGFIEGMKRGGHSLVGKHVLLVGAGGAGASIGFAIAEAGAQKLTINDLDTLRAQQLAQRINRSFPQCHVACGPAHPKGHHVIVNATPIGLKPEDPMPLDVAGLTPEMLVVDIIMEPRETALLKYATSLGCTVQYGQPMMDCQMELLAEFLQIRD